MAGLVVTVAVLVAAPFAAIAGALLGRWSKDAAARVAAGATGVGWLSALALGVLYVGDPGSTGLATTTSLDVQIDALAVVMLLMVLGLSTVIQFFAVRYLRGDARQLWFVVTANALTAATVVMVCADTVLWFTVAWLAAGASLVALLGTYSHLAQARRGARRTAVRFLLGDLALVGAVCLLMVTARGDVALNEVGDVLHRLPAGLDVVVAVILVIPALARSSQVPFHGWLPATLAAPTPVSALMHAGVVNAGAILILRFSPAIGQDTPAMALIFCAGALTLAYASVVRLVKPDAKGRLVFSTMAQMGYMMLACGLGAFAAAVFHLVAHGLFKSALFLGAGSGVAREARQRAWPVQRATPWPIAAASIVVAVTIPGAAIIAARTLLGVELTAASQALQLFVVFTAGVALGAMLWTHFSVATVTIGVVAITALAFGYTAAVALFERSLHFGPMAAAVSPWWLVIPATVLLALQLPRRNKWGGLVAPRIFALALTAGSPTTTIPRRAQLSQKETTS